MTTRIFFSLTSDKVGNASTGMILGDFNNWNPEEGIYLKKEDDGSLVAEMYLTPGQTYQYKYLLSDGRWMHDDNPRIFSEFFGNPVENCIIEVPQPATKKVAKPTVKKARSTPKDKSTLVVQDDLSLIQGITKKVSLLLNQHSILTFKDLGKCSIKKLQQILAEAGGRNSKLDPATWPKQAKLAAAGKWDELKTWQDQLKASK